MKHLKNLIIAVLFPILFISFVCVHISAKQSENVPVSPALSIIASKMEMKKCGLNDTDIHFTYDDFENFLHTKNVKSITITALPSEFEGKLYLKDIPVISNQTIYKNDIKDLRFSPASNEISSSVFHFSSTGASCESSVKCSMFLLAEINSAPTISLDAISGQKLSTQKNIMFEAGLIKLCNNENTIWK